MLMLKCKAGESVILTTAEGVRIEVGLVGLEPGAGHRGLERKTRLELATFSLARRRSAN